jgi:hypothetical protein
LPSGVGAVHQAVRQHLFGLKDAAFDVAFVQAQIADHQKTLLLLEHEIGSGSRGCAPLPPKACQYPRAFAHGTNFARAATPYTAQSTEAARPARPRRLPPPARGGLASRSSPWNGQLPQRVGVAGWRKEISCTHGHCTGPVSTHHRDRARSRRRDNSVPHAVRSKGRHLPQLNSR